MEHFAPSRDGIPGNVFNAAKETCGVVMIVGHVESRGAGDVDVIWRYNGRVLNGAKMCNSCGAQRVLEQLNLRRGSRIR